MGRTSEKFGLKSAAVALAVVGVVGMAGAQPGGIAGPSASASFSTEVNFESSIDWQVQKDMTLDQFGSVDVVAAFSALEMNPGNVGILKVRTHARHWDIRMSSNFGGRLATPGETIMVPTPPDCTPNWDCTGEEATEGPGEYLLYDPLKMTTLPTGNPLESVEDVSTDMRVVLDVAIGGAFENPANHNLYSIGCGPAGCGPAPDPIRLGKTKVLASNVATTAVSFAEAIGASTDTKFGGLTIGGVLLGTGENPRNNTDIATAGFNGNGADQYIYVNAGIHPDNTSKLQTLLPGKIYKETLTFTLYNGF